jgi:hypothetical protein
MPIISEAAPTSDFDRVLRGILYSLLTWQQLSEFWARIDPAAGWYLYAVGETAPDTHAQTAQVKAFIRQIDELLRRDHEEDYCGIVYADDLQHPSLVKIYDPHHLGSSCGSSKTTPLPGWIISRMPPTEIQSKTTVPANRKRWWQALLTSANN